MYKIKKRMYYIINLRRSMPAKIINNKKVSKTSIKQVILTVLQETHHLRTVNLFIIQLREIKS